MAARIAAFNFNIANVTGGTSPYGLFTYMDSDLDSDSDSDSCTILGMLGLESKSVHCEIFTQYNCSHRETRPSLNPNPSPRM